MEMRRKRRLDPKFESVRYEHHVNMKRFQKRGFPVSNRLNQWHLDQIATAKKTLVT